MATCESLQQIFESPLPETTPSLLDSLSPWRQFNPGNSIEDGSLNDHSLVNNELAPAASCYLMNSASLQLCTEGLGFESLDGAEGSKSEASNGPADSSVRSMDNDVARGRSTSCIGYDQYYRRGKSCVVSFPPPISWLGRAGKPSVCFKSYRQNGRFVLQEVRIPPQQYLRASRKDGRLRLSFVQPDDDDDNVVEEEEDEDEEEGGGVHEEESDGDDDEEGQEEYVKGNS